MKLIVTSLLIFFLVLHSLSAQRIDENPPAPGFNIEASDNKAIVIADEIMKALGGRANWDATRYISWNFFGRRKLFWDKHSGNVRIEIGQDIYLVNIQNNTGQVRIGNEVIQDPDSLQKYVERGISMWINDSYWLVMPFKLKDSGVTLRYMGEGATAEGASADILQLTFESVGRTPENKYLVYVDKQRRLIVQWDYFQKFNDEKPAISTPWLDYERHGTILLSGNRGGNRQLTEISVSDTLPASLFTTFDTP
jgi:plasmid maintenance system killer protein